MAKYCVYCGNPIVEGIDKFCIICGKPVLAGVKKPVKTEVEKARDIIKEKRTPKQRIIEESIEEDPFEAIPEVSEKKVRRKIKKE
ncbi:MAG: hypothetical protein HWN79_06675, partial [Candidatus Lokiarchaeota archaeon]|nr:hypothetical protein [Candidatus Lokiarchaeota archaeon]